jgi:uncharacterized protein with PIN domain
VTFFVDRSLGRRRLVEAIREAGYDSIAHDDHFAPDALDEVWLQRAGAEGWVVLTKDQRIRYREIERTALVRSGVRAFVFVQKQQAMPDIVESFQRALPAIMRTLAGTAAPFLAAIQAGGRVRVLLSRE